MKRKFPISNEQGFTLIEIISVIVILGIITSVGAQKADLLSTAADERALLEGVHQLNSLETMVWTNMKLSQTGWESDATVFSKIMEGEIGSEYIWKDGPNPTGGTLHFRSKSITLNRSPSTAASWGTWK